MAETPRKAEPALRGEDPTTGGRQMGACSPRGGRRAQQQKEPPTRRKAQSQADAHGVQGAELLEAVGEGAEGRGGGIALSPAPYRYSKRSATKTNKKTTCPIGQAAFSVKR